MNYDFSAWVAAHKGHTINYGFDGTGKQSVVCLTCGVSCDVEAISGKINASDTFITKAEARTLRGKLSPDVLWNGLKEAGK